MLCMSQLIPIPIRIIRSMSTLVLRKPAMSALICSLSVRNCSDQFAIFVILNPVSVIIPCHLVIPKESIDKMQEIRKKAESTIFKGDDLCLNSILNDSSIDFGEYALGRRLKRELIIKEMDRNNI